MNPLLSKEIFKAVSSIFSIKLLISDEIPDFNKKLYSSSLNAIRVLEAKKDIRELVAKKIKMNNGFKIGDTVVVVISDEKYKGKIVKVKKNNRCRVYISALETTLTFKSSDITLKQRK